MLFRASRLATPAVSALLSLGVGAAAAVHVASASTAAAAAASPFSFSKLADGLLAVNTPAADNQVAMGVVAVVAALAALRLLSVAGYHTAATPGRAIPFQQRCST